MLIKLRSKKYLLIWTLLLTFILSACTQKGEETVQGKKAQDPGKQIVEEIEGYSGRERVVSKEEYEFYEYFVDRELYEEVSEEEFAKKVEEYANEVSAIFYLGNKLDLCEPYGFSTLKMRCEQENDIRKIKKEKGEPIYGLEQFTLENYFQYQKDQVELDLISYFQSLEGEWLLEEARKFYEENKDGFRYRQEVTYEVTTDGKTELLTADADVIGVLSNADGSLADFLVSGKEGEELQDTYDMKERRVIIKEVVYNQEAAVMEYVNQELYPYLIDRIAEQNPVKIEK